MNTLESMRAKRAEFAGSEPGREEDSGQAKVGLDQRSPWDRCNEIYLAAFDRVGMKADYLDRVNEAQVEPVTWELSEIFFARVDELTVSIEAEWLRDHPDIDKFTELVIELETLCKVELDTILTRLMKIESQPG